MSALPLWPNISLQATFDPPQKQAPPQTRLSSCVRCLQKRSSAIFLVCAVQPETFKPVGGFGVSAIADKLQNALLQFIFIAVSTVPSTAVGKP